MSKLTKTDVLHVAKLAKLELTDKEIDKFTPQLSSIVEFVSELSEVETKDVEPTSQSTGLEDVYRADEVKGESSLTQEQAISGTDETYNGYFKVMAILEGRTDK